jgi:hypothetical protein
MLYIEQWSAFNCLVRKSKYQSFKLHRVLERKYLGSETSMAPVTRGLRETA